MRAFTRRSRIQYAAMIYHVVALSHVFNLQIYGEDEKLYGYKDLIVDVSPRLLVWDCRESMFGAP